MKTRLEFQVVVIGLLTAGLVCAQAEPQPLRYNNPDLVVDLGVGLWAWPLPMDYDEDGDMDLVVVCPDKPYNGTYWFENRGRHEPGKPQCPIFEPARRIDRAIGNPQLSWVRGRPVVLTPERQYPKFRQDGFAGGSVLPIKMATIHSGRVRANQWRLADLDGDDRQDLVIGVGDWTDYGWDNAYDDQGEWQNGPLHGWIYWVRNEGTEQQPVYSSPQKLKAGTDPIDVYGMPSPNLADWDSDGDLDLLCGEFLDGFTYYRNIGTSGRPEFAPGVRLQSRAGQPLTMDLQMIVPVAVDWDRDGDWDLVVGDEDGRVALLECQGLDGDGIPSFADPHYFQQRADRVKFGALVTPYSVDWDGDGDDDLICGNTAGYVGWIENLDGGQQPRWAAPRKLLVGESPLRIKAGPRGSIQGPCEAKWGYTALSVADWDDDGQLDLVVNSIWGQVVVYRGQADPEHLRMSDSTPVQVAWLGDPPKPAWNWWQPTARMLATQWRTTPQVIDWNQDGLNDLVMLDHEGYLAYFERFRDADQLKLKPGRRIFRSTGPSAFDSRHGVLSGEPGLLRLNGKSAGGSGRRKFCFGDWDGDGELDLLVNSVSVDWFAGRASEPGAAQGDTYLLEPRGTLTPLVLAGHTTSPTLVDWDRDGHLDLLIGAEDGFLYYLPRTAQRD